MKKIKPILKIVSFSLILAAMLYVLSFLAKPDSYNLEHIAGFYSEKPESIDLVYIGGSAAFVYYEPLKSWQDHGIVSYDYAADSIQAELYPTMIREVLKTQSPKLIVIDARAFQYRDEDNMDAKPPEEVHYRNTLTGMRLSKNKIDFIDQYVGDVLGDKKLSYYLDIIKYHDNIVCFNGNSIKVLMGTYKDPYNGFYFCPKVKEVEQYDFRTEEKKALSEETEKILTELLDEMDSTGVEYLFTVSPYSEKKEHKMTFNTVQEIVEKRGYRFIDCNEYAEEMGLDYSTDLYNEDHVNVFGAEKYTDFLNQYILQNFSIPDRRGDASYSFMNDYLDDWKRDELETKAAITKQIEERKHES